MENYVQKETGGAFLFGPFLKTQLKKKKLEGLIYLNISKRGITSSIIPDLTVSWNPLSIPSCGILPGTNSKSTRFGRPLERERDGIEGNRFHFKVAFQDKSGGGLFFGPFSPNFGKTRLKKPSRIRKSPNGSTSSIISPTRPDATRNCRRISLSTYPSQLAEFIPERIANLSVR